MDNEGGGFSGANRCFDEINTRNVRNLPNEERAGGLNDGSIIPVRPDSVPMISVRRPGSAGGINQIVIRF